jgi:hypothetical protein
MLFKKLRSILFFKIGPAGPFLYVAVMAVVVWGSYRQPVLYRFHDSPTLWLVCILAVVVTVYWHGKLPQKVDWWLPAVLVALALASYPDTSRDYLRYLFDGQMVRLWHLSPYTHLPGQFPADQYSRLFRPVFWVAMPSPYGPLSQAMMAGLNFVTGNRLAAGIVALKLVNLVGLVACARLMFLITGRSRASYLLLINPIVLLNTVATPHLDILVVGGVLAAYYGRHPWGKGLALAAAGLVKPHALIFAPLVSRRPRVAGLTLAWTVVAVAGLLVLLKPLVHFDVLPMLFASHEGGLFAHDSLLMQSLLPHAPASAVVGASYGLFVVGYAAVVVALVRGKLSPIRAMMLASWLVPLCLTGLLLPWHFVMPLVFLLLTEGVVEYWLVLFLTLLVLRSAVTVVELLATAAVVGGGGWVIYQLMKRQAKQPKLYRAIVAALGISS